MNVNTVRKVGNNQITAPLGSAGVCEDTGDEAADILFLYC